MFYVIFYIFTSCTIFIINKYVSHFNCTLAQRRQSKTCREDLIIFARGMSKIVENGLFAVLTILSKNSLDFAVTRFLIMKLFRTSNTEIVAECQHYFGFSLPSKLMERKRTTFASLL